MAEKNRLIFDQLFRKEEIRICLQCDCLLEVPKNSKITTLHHAKLYCSQYCYNKYQYQNNPEFRAKKIAADKKCLAARTARKKAAAKNKPDSDE